MIEPQLKELINKDIDGQLTVDERARLGQSLRRNAKARTFHKELRGLATTLASVRPADPPRHLANRIRALVHANDAPALPVKASWRNTLRSLLHPPIMYRYFYAFAGGLLAGVCLLFVASQEGGPGSVGDAELTGTLVLEGRAPGFVTGGHIDVNTGAIKGAIETQFRSGLCLFRMNLQSPGAVTAYIQTDPSAVEVEAVRPSDNSGAQLTVHDGEIAVVGPNGNGIVVLFAGKGEHLPPARLRLLSSGKLVFDGVVALEQAK